MLEFINHNPITGTLLVLFLALIAGNVIVRVVTLVKGQR